jgi:O-antigen/teichoic acid export membrane protein
MDVTLKRNVFWKAVEAAVTIVASFLQLAVIARSFDPQSVGRYQLALAWLFLVSALSCFGGIVMVSTRELSNRDVSEHRSIFSAAVVLQTIIAVPMYITCVTVFFSVNYFSTFSLPLSVGSVALLGGLILQMSQALLVSREQIKTVVRASIIAHSVATVSIVVSASYGLSVDILVILWASYHIVNGLILSYFTSAWQLISLRVVQVSEVVKLLREIVQVLVMVLATHLYVRIDVIMLDYFTTKETVARYGAGYVFLDQLMIPSNFMMGALFPNFARSCPARGSEYRMLYHGILVVFAKYLAPIALSIALLSDVLLGWFYGAEYSAAWLSLSILMLAAVFAWLNGPSGTIFISLRKQHIYMWATLLSLLVNVLGNLVFIPVMGAVGAAVSTVLTEATICSFCLWWIHRETGYLPWRRPKA